MMTDKSNIAPNFSSISAIQRFSKAASYYSGQGFEILASPLAGVLPRGSIAVSVASWWKTVVTTAYFLSIKS
jgi:hypothetical protein